MTEKYGKAICVGLYSVFAFMAAKKKPLPFLILLASHAAEYQIMGKKVAEDNGIDTTEALVNCLCFGFTWWLPIKKGA